MTLETFLTGPNLVILGLMIWAGLMWRNAVANSRLDSPIPQSQETRLPSARDLETQIRDLKTRLVDFDRDLSTRVDTALDLLDQVIDEADREIVRLEDLLAKRQAECEPPGSVVHLPASGYSESRIEDAERAA